MIAEFTQVAPWCKEYIGMGHLREPFRLIHYYYPIKAIREEVWHRTSMIGRHMETKEGGHMLDKVALTADEESTMDLLLNEASVDLYSVLQPFMMDIAEGYWYDRDADTEWDTLQDGEMIAMGSVVRWLDNGEERLSVALTDVEVDKANEDITDATYRAEKFEDIEHPDILHSVHYMIRKPQWVLENSVAQTDKKLKECLILYVMNKWFLMIGMYDQAQVYGQMQEMEKSSLRMLLNAHRRMSVRSHPF